MKKLGFIFITSIFLFGCSSENLFEVNEFSALDNYKGKNDELKELSLDYQGAFENGFIIPSKNQTENGFFDVKFQIRNNSKTPKRYFYKLYYQNETYKFDEDTTLSNENFYGSWEDLSVDFKETAEISADGNYHEIKTSFRIIGNPRNEKQFFGSKEVGPITEEEIIATANSIKNIPEWYNMIIEKSKTNEISVEKQLYLDAVYTANQKRESGDFNNRWKRNPRVGEYKFMLVVVDNADTLNQIPQHIRNISKTDVGGNYENPFSFFKNYKNPNVQIYYSSDRLKVVAKPNFDKGVFVNKLSFTRGKYDSTYYSENCNASKHHLLESNFEQFISSFNAEHKFKNIPIVADVHGGAYTKSDYYENFTKNHEFIMANIEIPSCPCKNIEIDKNKNKATLINSATKPGEWRKENVGIITRHGLTYGKYRVKAKLPPLLNKDNLWNGLTNAVWLIYQQGNWNKRRICNTEGGYVLKSYPGHGDVVRTPIDVYSEIDIEIVKASRNWPLSSYGGDASKKPKDPETDSNKVMVTYTNWDLACKDPKNFNRGVFTLNHNNVNYDLHRWDYWYQAITGKYGALSNELFKSEYYWYEIEWKPEEIIWRIGPEKDQMYEIGYMNSSITSVPNNQMLLIVTQEWHLENWWPEAPFNQNFIPFPAKEIKGEVLEVEIE